MVLPAAGLYAHTPAGLMRIGRYPLLSLTRNLYLAKAKFNTSSPGVSGLSFTIN
jgi:hypothetical protein